MDENQQQASFKRLGIVFDIDGTLALETDSNSSDHDDEIILRDGGVDFLKWCRQRGHSLALWTAASEDHLHRCLARFCPLVVDHHPSDNDEGVNQTPCSPQCRNTFEFCWSHSKLKRQNLPNNSYCQDSMMMDGTGCRWCQWYRHSCTRCRCDTYVYACPCQYTKDLSKVWKNSAQYPTFCKERTLIVENTPQQCIDNYGNAIYVPTFCWQEEDEALEAVLFDRLKELILQLERVPDVRQFRKCSQVHGHAVLSGKPHACFHQDWLYSSKWDDKDKTAETTDDDG